MKRIALWGLALAAVTAAGTGGYWAGDRGIPIPGVAIPDALAFPSAQPVGANVTVEVTEVTEPTEPVIYYRDPDARPVYSAAPRRAESGRAFIAV